MLISETAPLVAGAFRRILGHGLPGDIAFVTFFPSSDVDVLCKDSRFSIGGWDVLGVADRNDANARLITADHAVELREAKAGALLLLIDRHRAGAGLDGIYSASREIAETKLLESAIDLARADLSEELRTISRLAIRHARLGGRRNLDPWRVLSFYAAVASGSSLGEAIITLGLWPIEGESSFKMLEASGQMVFRLFAARERTATVQDLVASLLLRDQEKAAHVAEYLRAVRNLNRFAAVERLRDDGVFGSAKFSPVSPRKILTQ